MRRSRDREERAVTVSIWIHTLLARRSKTFRNQSGAVRNKATVTTRQQTEVEPAA
jgi:hypothetical protein